jgi:hypothetical protein
LLQNVSKYALNDIFKSKRAKGLYKAPLEIVSNDKLDSTIATGLST